MRLLSALFLSIPLLLSSSARGDTIAYYRFEGGLTADSSGNGYSLSITGSPTNPALPGSGNGSKFPNSIYQTGASNLNAAQFSNSSQLLSRTFGSAPVTGSFTIEAFVNASSFPGGYGDLIATNLNIPTTPTSGWALQFRNDGALGTQPHEMLLSLYDGTTLHPALSGFAPAANTDYYVAATFDATTHDVTFFWKNLTANGALQSSTVNLPGVWNLAGATPFTIGGSVGPITGLQFDGLIDEFRLSNQVLSQNQLLSFTPPPLAPEPTSIVLFALLAIAGLGQWTWRRRRSSLRSAVS